VRFLANENIPGQAVKALQDRGHDIVWIHSDSPGITDREILTRAQSENRILLTFDKGFGELAFRSGLPATSGVILFRISAPSPEIVARIALSAVDSREDWPGHFSVIEDQRIRMTPLPGRAA
jgi:predicted nuclease of predicted toxin-antitoxin system